MSSSDVQSQFQEQLQHQLAHYNENQAPRQFIACIVFLVLLAIAVTARILAQFVRPNQQALRNYDLKSALRRWDAWFIYLAAVFAAGTTATNILAYQHGLGKHQIRVIAEDPTRAEDTVAIIKFAYIIRLIQTPSLMFTKLAIICLYHRIFSQGNKIFKYSLLAVAIWSIALAICSMVEFAITCIPVDYCWNRVYILLGMIPPNGGSITGYCMPTVVSTVIPVICDLVSEIALLILPAFALWNVQLSLQRKVGLYFLFTLGGFVTSISIIRLYYTWALDDGPDITWITAPAFLWTSCQTCIAVVCACIPASAPLYRYIQERCNPTKETGCEASSTNKDSLTKPSLTHINEIKTQSAEQVQLMPG